jgi:HD-like signal output (HDOD) protein
VGVQLSQESVIRALRRIPPFPPIAAKLLILFSTKNPECKEVAELIGTDPTLSGRLLQCVNSYEFGLAQTVVDVNQAVMLLGLERTRREIVTFATGVFARGTPEAGELRRCWEHSVATALLAEQIAATCQESAGVAYTAGILHDIGRLGLVVAYPREYESIVRDAAKRCLDVLDFERETFGMHHTEAGRLLIGQWGLPSEFLGVAGRHHDACEGEELHLLRIVHVACRLADALGYGVSEPLAELTPKMVLADLPERFRDRMCVPPDSLRARIDQRLRSYDCADTGTTPDTCFHDSALESALASPFEGVAADAGSRLSPAALVAVAALVLAAASGFLAWR